MLCIGLTLLVILSFESLKMAVYLASYIDLKIDVQMMFCLSSSMLARFRINYGWICDVHRLFV